MMRLLHGSFPAIEQALLERLAYRPPLEPAVVVAPSARLVRHLKRAAAERFPEGLLGVSFMHLFHLAAEMAPPDRPLVREPIFFERLVVRLLRGPMAGAPFLGRSLPTYDLAAALLGAIRDLKDAGVEPDPEAVVRHVEELIEQQQTLLTRFDILKLNDVMCLYRHYEEALAAAGVMDASDLLAAAARGKAPARRIFVTGFYDMTQVQWNLVLSLAAQAELTLLTPYEEGPMRFAERFFKSYACAKAGVIEAVEGPGPRPERELYNAAGERDEVWGAAKRILASGVRPDRIGVVARTLEPYLPHVEAIFGEHRIPFVPPRGRRLAHEPRMKYLRALHRLGLDDFPRGATLDVLTSPFFEGPADRGGWAAITAARRIARGAGVWRERLARPPGRREQALGIRPEAVAALSEAFERLAAFVGSIPARGRWADFLGAAPEIGRLLPRLGDLGEEEIAHEEFQEAFERELDRLEAPSEPRGGVTVTDVMGARGLRFHTLFVLGLNSHSFPRFILEEPFISDRARRDVFEMRGHKIAVRHEGYDEERLLFHLVRSAATDRLVLAYQRSDAEGRIKDPSPFLELKEDHRKRVTAVPRSIRQRLAGMRPQEMTRAEALLYAETVAGDPKLVARCLRAFGGDAARYERAREVIGLLEGGPLSAHEGQVGRVNPPEVMSPTALETYHACPFQYFARYVLGLAPLEDPERIEDLSDDEIGTLQHAILERHHRDGLSIAQAAEAAVEDLAPPLYPALRTARVRHVTRVLEVFVAWEAAHRGSWRPAEFEVELEGVVAGLKVHGRIDRIDRDGDRRRVVDYKKRMSGYFKTSLGTQAKDGRKVQAPIYVKLAGADEAAFYFVEEPFAGAPERDRVRELPADWWKEGGAAFEASLKAVRAGIAAGRFPVAPPEPCKICTFESVCRKNYTPTVRKLS